MHGEGLSDDEAICNELADCLAGVGVGDFAGLIGIKPDLALSAANDGGRQALLGGEIDPIVNIPSQLLLNEVCDACRVPAYIKRATAQFRWIWRKTLENWVKLTSSLIPVVVGDGRRRLSMSRFIR